MHLADNGEIKVVNQNCYDDFTKKDFLRYLESDASVRGGVCILQPYLNFRLWMMDGPLIFACCVTEALEERGKQLLHMQESEATRLHQTLHRAVVLGRHMTS